MQCFALVDRGAQRSRRDLDQKVDDRFGRSAECRCLDESGGSCPRPVFLRVVDQFLGEALRGSGIPSVRRE